MTLTDQIISKGLLVSSKSSKNQTKEFILTTSTNSFVHFLGESSAWQFAFENNWPLANDVLLVSKILLRYEEALRPRTLEISHVSQILTHEPQILVLSLLFNYYWTAKILLILQNLGKIRFLLQKKFKTTVYSGPKEKKEGCQNDEIMSD